MTIFEKIIAGEIPSYKIYEDEKVLAFLDINPKNLGHTLLIPKKPYPYLWDVEEKDYIYLMNKAKELALHLKNKMETSFVRLDVVGTDVPHTHIHLIPFDPGINGEIEGKSLKLTEQEFKQLAEKLKL